MTQAIALEFKKVSRLGNDVFIRAVPVKPAPKKGGN
jgi:hypothetical protein